MVRIAVLDDYQNLALELADWSVLPDEAEVTAFNDHLHDLDAVAERLRDFEIVAIMRERTPFPRALFDRLPKLKLLVTTGARNFSIDLDAAAEHGVTVCGTEGSGNSTVDLTWGLILALVRRIPHEHEAMRTGRWETALGHGLHGKTLGIIGLGRLGAAVARVGAAFGMEVMAWSHNLTAERAATCDAAPVTKHELLARADVVTLHLVLSERTHHLVGRREFELMKPTSYLINTSRGPIVDQHALIAALSSGRIAGAGLDVYDVEPLPADHPLRRLGNAILTPHVGYVTEENYRRFYAQTVADIAAFLAGAPIRVLSPS